MSDWLDISRPIRNGMPVWPGDPEVRIEPVTRIEDGAPCNVTALSLCAHAGTHVDAPLHYFQGGAGVDAMPLEACVGPARCIELLELDSVQAGERVLLKGVLDAPAAARLAARRPLLVGTGGMTIGDDQTHRVLLGAGVWILEGLDLSGVPSGCYDLICLPLRLAGADGAPARALLRPRAQSPGT